MAFHRVTLAVWLAAILLVGMSGAATADSLPQRGDAAVAAPAAARGLQAANGMLNRGHYDLAADEYRRFLVEHPEHERAGVARYGLAVCLFRAEQYEAAVGELERLEPMVGFAYSAEVGTMLGRAHLELGRHGDAAAAFDRVAATHRRHALADDAVAGAAEALYLEGRYRDAIARARLLEKHWPDSPLRCRTVFYRALSEMAEYDYAGAAERFQETLVVDPQGVSSREARFRLGQCLEQSGQTERAVEVYRDIVKRANSPRVDDARLALAGVLYRQGRFDEAAETYAASAASATDRKDEIDYWLAKCDLGRGEFAAAARGLRTLIDQHPRSTLLPEATYDGAVALLKAGDSAAARKTLSGFGDSYPEHDLAGEALWLLAVLAHRDGDYTASQTHCRVFLAMHAGHPRTVEVGFLSAENDYFAGRLPQALERYQQFVEQYPEDSREPVSRLRAGMAAYRLERFDAAAKWFEGLALGDDVSAEIVPALLALGDIRLQQERWADAERLFAKYLAVTSESAKPGDEALLKLGLSRQRQGKHAEALDAYERLAALFPESVHLPQARFERGRAYRVMGRPAEAAAAFEKVVESDNAMAHESDRAIVGYAWHQLGCLAARAGEFGLAAERFRQAAKLIADPTMRAEALFQHGASLMGAERYGDAKRVFDSLADEMPRSERAAAARAQAAIAVARQGRSDDAIDAIRVAERDVGALPGELRASLQYEKAWALRQTGDTMSARRAYRELLGIPDATAELKAHATLELAEMLAEADEHAAAAKLLRELGESGSAAAAGVAEGIRARLAYRLGVAEFDSGNVGSAARAFEAFLDQFSQDALAVSACLYCGEALFRAGHAARAVPYLERVVTQAVDEDMRGSGMLRLGEVLAVLQRWAGSECVFADFAQRYPDSEMWFQARFGAGWACENQGRYGEAVAAYADVIMRHRGETAARAQFQIGECLFAQKRYGEAVAEFLKTDILFAYPEWSSASLYEAGRCFEKLGKIAEARQQFEMVTREHPDSQWAALAGGQLTSLADEKLPGR